MKLAVLGAAHVCARCAKRGFTCCEPEEGVALAPLTHGDIDRIQAATGLNRKAFVRTRTIHPEEQAALEEDNPELRGLVQNGKLRSLAKQKGKRACVFHDPAKGCSLAWDVRPLLCRRFPFVGSGRRVRVQPGGDCLAVDEARNLPELLEILGMPEERLKALDRQIRRELSAGVPRKAR